MVEHAAVFFAGQGALLTHDCEHQSCDDANDADDEHGIEDEIDHGGVSVACLEEQTAKQDEEQLARRDL